MTVQRIVRYRDWRALQPTTRARTAELARGLPLPARTRPREPDTAVRLREIGTPEYLIGPAQPDLPVGLAAQVLGTSEDELQRLLATGELPHTEVEGERRVSYQDLQSLAKTVGSPSATRRAHATP